MIASHQTPLRKDGFTFKRFFVAHNKSPMKVTTDSCLLGAWVPIDVIPQKVLDIGTGCGVIALMLAQRLENTHCKIDAIDIDHHAIAQCNENSKQASFYSICAKHADINQFRLDQPACYDLIVSNPPYFESAVDCRDIQRQLARYTESLSYQQLINAVKRLLTPKGQFCLVLPYHLSNHFRFLCESNFLYLTQVMNVRYSSKKDFSLALMAFSLSRADLIIEDQLCMRDDDGCYSQSFRQLLADFYLFRK
ncbi:hypothetical protein A9G45_03165 [Gilliamella sp. HK2]|jgi:tRNA1Val (adenine37-N6)-methyltransferase|uniref:tRNA1(Val) (adenine(37)-N6)-methyltransferase n=2 Tax=unclassified Gilliamella TaxID=2685620 RepID=UPI00080E7040|nr:methyltransferase [Gilliamella apicola]OCG26136.1 hypothetical protein A9G46_05690 [Gilliamella apicola]OCG29903.1 hypothetical protein A9G45_03165 [Gilliamella apicola]